MASWKLFQLNALRGTIDLASKEGLERGDVQLLARANRGSIGCLHFFRMSVADSQACG